MASKLAHKCDRIRSASGSSKRHATGHSTTSTPCSVLSTQLRGLCDSQSILRRVIRYLNDDQRLQQEGIFRKTGNVSRVRELKARLSLCGDQTPLSLSLSPCEPSNANQSTPCRVDTSAAASAAQAQPFSVHDVVGVLKALLADFAQPLVTDDLFEIFCDVNAKWQSRSEDNGQTKKASLSEEDCALVDAKCQKAFRLLMLMLPLDNRSVLFDLLNLLHCTLQHTQQNKMSAEALGTVFAPLIVGPRKISASDYFSAQQKARIIPTATRLVEQSNEIFRIPLDVALDMAKHLQKVQDSNELALSPCCMSQESSRSRVASCLLLSTPPSCCTPTSSQASCSSGLVESISLQRTPKNNDDVLDTCVAFATDSKPSAATDHKQIVADLYAQVQALPDSKRKCKLLAKLHKLHAFNDGQKHLKKGTKRRRLASFLSKLANVENKENKENSSHSSGKDIAAKRSALDTPVRNASMEPSKLYAVLVPPKMDKTARSSYCCLDDTWEQTSCTWPAVLHSTFVKQNKA